MSKVKDRGNDVTTKPQEKIDMGRLANIGETIDLVISSGEVISVTVKEPSGEQTLRLIGHLFPVLEIFRGESSNLVAALSSEEVFSSLREVASVITNRSKADFVDMPITSWGELIKTMRKVVDWEKLSEFFHELGLTDLLMKQNPAS